MRVLHLLLGGALGLGILLAIVLSVCSIFDLILYTTFLLCGVFILGFLFRLSRVISRPKDRTTIAFFHPFWYSYFECFVTRWLEFSYVNLLCNLSVSYAICVFFQ